MIVKVQIPLSSNVKDPPCLVYPQNRAWTLHVALETRFAMDCNESGKAYYQAHFNDDGDLIIGKRVADQDW
jgi:hypothetical protein